MTAVSLIHRERWQAGEPDALRWAHWGGEYVLFHEASGLTHLVNEPTARLLREILVEPADLSQIAARLGSVSGAEGAADFAQQVAVLLERLDVLGLVQRRPA